MWIVLYVLSGFCLVASLLLCDDRLAVYTAKHYRVIPTPSDMKGVTGVCIGCIGLIPFEEGDETYDSHAHTDGAFKGWVCFRKESLVHDRGLRMHETAHILAGGGHGEAWRCKYFELLMAPGEK